MKVIYYSKGNIEPRQNTKHEINFFGVLGCIRVNALDEDTPEKKKGTFNIVKHYFDYPYFSRIVNPKFFEEKLNKEEKKFGRKIISLWLCSAILSTASTVSLYLAYQEQKSKKVITGLAFTSLVLLTLATICFVIACLWVFFNFVKGKFIAHRIKNFLENEVSPEWIKRYKQELIGETCDQGLEKDIDDIIEFLLERKKVVALYKFLTNGEKLVQAGMVMVDMLLRNGIHPNDIILDTNSLGGGIAAEVLKRFEEQGICLTLIHSNSYSSLKDTVRDSPKSLVKWLPSMLLNFWFKRCGLDFNSREIVENTKCPVLIVGRAGDTVIPKEAQLVYEFSNRPTETGQFRISRELEHDPKKPCESKNIHIDHKEHLVYCENSNGTEKCTSYEEIESDFIDEAHQHLIKHGFNEEFELEKYKESSFSGKLTEIKLQSFNGQHIQV